MKSCYLSGTHECPSIPSASNAAFARSDNGFEKLDSVIPPVIDNIFNGLNNAQKTKMLKDKIIKYTSCLRDYEKNLFYKAIDIYYTTHLDVDTACTILN